MSRIETTGYALVAPLVAPFIAALVSVSMPSFAQEPPHSQSSNTRASTMDRTSKIDRTYQTDQNQDRDQAKDFSKLNDREIYGNQVMTRAERKDYRQTLTKAGHADAREQYRAEHQTEMHTRADAKGIKLDPTSEGAIYGSSLMSSEERDQHRANLRSMETADARSAYVAQHHEEMQTRAQRQGVEINELQETEEAE